MSAGWDKRHPTIKIIANYLHRFSCGIGGKWSFTGKPTNHFTAFIQVVRHTQLRTERFCRNIFTARTPLLTASHENATKMLRHLKKCICKHTFLYAARAITKHRLIKLTNHGSTELYGHISDSTVCCQEDHRSIKSGPVAFSRQTWLIVSDDRDTTGLDGIIVGLQYKHKNRTTALLKYRTTQ